MSNILIFYFYLDKKLYRIEGAWNQIYDFLCKKLKQVPIIQNSENSKWTGKRSRVRPEPDAQSRSDRWENWLLFFLIPGPFLLLTHHSFTHRSLSTLPFPPPPKITELPLPHTSMATLLPLQFRNCPSPPPPKLHRSHHLHAPTLALRSKSRLLSSISWKLRVFSSIYCLCKSNSDVQSVSGQDELQRPPFDINLAVVLAGFAFEAYSSPPVRSPFLDPCLVKQKRNISEKFKPIIFSGHVKMINSFFFFFPPLFLTDQTGCRALFGWWENGRKEKNVKATPFVFYLLSWFLETEEFVTDWLIGIWRFLFLIPQIAKKPTAMFI